MEWWEPILAEYGDQPGLTGLGKPTVSRAGGPGYSGAGIWRVATAEANYALRRWPPGEPDVRRLEFIHHVIAHARRHGAPPLAGPIPTDRGATWINYLGHLWELSPWLPGAADYRDHPSDERLAAALRGLAQFHTSTRDFAAQYGPSPGLKYRHQLAQRIDAITAAWHSSPYDCPTVDVRHRMGELLLPLLLSDPSWERFLRTACQRSWNLQPCLRDIWHAHVFFQADRLTGLIDFGAVNWEHRSADVGRLLGSLVGMDARGWSTGLAAYQDIWPLEREEIELAQQFHSCNIHLSGLSWADWIYVQRRVFADWSAVAARLDELQQLSRSDPSHTANAPQGQIWLPPSPDSR